MTTTSRKLLPFSRIGDREPEHMDEASTFSSLLRGGEGWLYYRQPVQNYLRGLGCQDQDVEDLCHEILIKLQTYIVLNYDPTRSFRPYFKAAIRNFYFNHLRTIGVGTRETPDLAQDAPPEDPLTDGLADYARQVYEIFARDADPQIAKGIDMLHAWIIDDVRQDELARQAKLTPRQVRNHIGQAADALALWMGDRVNADDIADLAAQARRQGLAFDLGPTGLRGLFSHASREKRVRTLLILALIYRDQLLPRNQD